MIINYGNNVVMGFNSMTDDRTLRHHHDDYLTKFSAAYGGGGLPLPLGEWMRFREDHREVPEIAMQGWHFYQDFSSAYHEWHTTRNQMTLNLYGGLADIGEPNRKNDRIISAEYRMCLGRVNISKFVDCFDAEITGEYFAAPFGERNFVYMFESAIEKIIFTGISGAFAFFLCAAPGSKENQKRLDGTMFEGIHWRTAKLFAQFLSRTISYVYKNGYIPYSNPNFEELFAPLTEAVDDHKRFIEDFPEHLRSDVDVIFDPDFLCEFTRYIFQSFDSGGSIYSMSHAAREKFLPRLLAMTPVMQSVFKFYYDTAWLITESNRKAMGWANPERAAHFIIHLCKKLALNHDISDFEKRLGSVSFMAGVEVLDLLQGLYHYRPVMGKLRELLPDTSEEELLTAARNLFAHRSTSPEDFNGLPNHVGQGFVIGGFDEGRARFDF